MKSELRDAGRREGEEAISSELHRLKDSNATLESKANELSLDVDRLKAEIEDLQKDKMLAQKRHRMELNELKKDLDSKWQRRLDQNIKRGNEQGTELSFSYRIQLEDLTKKNQDLRKVLEEKQETITSLTGKLAEMEDSSTLQKLNANRKQGEVEDLHRKLEVKDARIKSHEAEILAYKDKSLINERRIAELREELEDTKAYLSDIKRLKGDDEIKLKVMQAERTGGDRNLSSKLESIDYLTRELAESNRYAATLEAELDSKDEQILRFEEAHSKVLEQLNGYEGANQNLLEIRDTLISQLNSLTVANEEITYQKLDFEKKAEDALRKVDIIIEEEVDREALLQERIQELQIDQDQAADAVQQTEIRNDQLEQENQQLKQLERDLLDLIVKERDQSIERIEKERHLESELQKATQALEATNSTSNRLQKMYEDTEHKFVEAQESRRALAHEKGSISEQLNQASSENRELMKKLKARESELQFYGDHLRSIEKKVESLEEENEHLRVQHEDERLNEQNAQSIAEYKEQISHLAQNLRIASDKNRQLEYNLQDLERRLEMQRAAPIHQNGVRVSHQQLTSLIDERNQIEEELDQSRHQNRILHNQVESERSHSKSLERELERLRNESNERRQSKDDPSISAVKRDVTRRNYEVRTVDNESYITRAEAAEREFLSRARRNGGNNHEVIVGDPNRFSFSKSRSISRSRSNSPVIEMDVVKFSAPTMMGPRHVQFHPNIRNFHPNK